MPEKRLPIGIQDINTCTHPEEKHTGTLILVVGTCTRSLVKQSATSTHHTDNSQSVFGFFYDAQHGRSADVNDRAKANRVLLFWTAVVGADSNGTVVPNDDAGSID